MTAQPLRRATLFMVLAVSFFASAHAMAQGSELYVPQELKPWVPWVMHGHEDLACSQVGERFLCDWPGELSMTVEAKQGLFTQRVYLDRALSVTLPGGGRYWPQDVSVAGEEMVVVEGESTRPSIELPAGEHVIRGRLAWSKTPEVVAIPKETGRVSLRYLGEEIKHPRFDDQGRLWIREAGAQAVSEADTLRVSVYRKLQDGVPLRVTTLLELNVAGRAREMTLGDVFLEGARVVDARSPLPLQISNGELKVYVRPGTHQLEIDALLLAPAESLAVPARASDIFDEREIWVWHPDEAMRSVELDGLLTVDPGRTTLPAKWHGATTLVAPPGAVLKMTSTRRGEADMPPNQLSLRREIWLDIDGLGYTLRDNLSGTLHQEWRLDYGRDAGKLGRVRELNTADDLLITQSTRAPELDGVELRAASINLEAEVRMESARAELPAVGWEHNVQSLEGTLHLPPGWSILAARGVDQMESTWLDSWNLFEFFLVIMIAFAMGKLFGWPWGVIAAVGMVLSHGQPDAPRYVWFHLVGILALLRVLPDKPWLRYPAIAYLVMVCIALATIFGSYAHKQIRHGLHPQVGSPMYAGPVGQVSDRFVAMDMVEEDSPVEVSESYDRSIVSSLTTRKGSFGGKQQNWKAPVQQQIDPNEVVQTGPGLPTWSWSTWSLRWTGPVARGHVIQLWLVSPFWNLVLRFLSVAVFLLMSLVALAPGRFSQRREDQFDIFAFLKKVTIPALAIMSLGGLGVMSTPELAMAQEPGEVFANELPAGSQAPNVQHLQNFATPNLSAPTTLLHTSSDSKLQVLEQRLIDQSKCKGKCLVVPWMTLRLEDTRLIIQAEVHAQREAGWAIPGPASVIAIDTVTLDGIATTKLRRVPGQMVLIKIPKGKHIVRVDATMLAQNVVTLQLDPFAKPRRVSVEGSGWGVDGLDEYGRPDNSLQLSRQEARPENTDAAPSATSTSLELAPWYFVERTLMLAMPWQTRTVVRRDLTDRPQLVKIPLLAGESVITDGVRVEEGMALVNFPRGEGEIMYISELAIPEGEEAIAFELKAPVETPWTETWRLECSRIWRCGFEGLSPTQTITDGIYAPVWNPWPGEKVSVRVRKPLGSVGEASTITSVSYEVWPGQRRLQAELSFELRASQGGWQRITLPAGAELQEVMINGASRNIRPEGDRVSLPIQPGEQSYKLRWMQDWDHSVVESFPAVDLGGKAVNVKMTLNMGKKRWLLWTMGPSWGPAVLFWSHIVLLLLIAIVLGRLKHLPLRTHHWLLLAIGMSQLPVIALLPIFVWFTMLAWRERRPFESWFVFNIFQVAILFMTLVLVVILFEAVRHNLIVDVDMQVRGMGSSNHKLSWYTDRIESTLPSASVLSVPLLIWRAAMLAWALWLVASLVKWFPWAWRALGKERFVMRPPAPAMAEPAPEAQAPLEAPTQRVSQMDGSVTAEEEGEEPAP